MNDELLLDENQVSESLAVTFKAKRYLTTISKWGKFLAVLHLLSAVLMFIASINFMVTYYNNEMGAQFYRYNSFLGIGVFYMILSIASFIMSFHLTSFCKKVKKSITDINSEILEKSLNHLKNYILTFSIAIIAIIATILTLNIQDIFRALN